MSSKTATYTSPLLLIHLLTLFLGISFTIIPASANFLISEKGMHLSKLDYGNLFILLISGALFVSYFAGNIVKKIGLRSLLIFGVIMTASSMALLSLENLVLHEITFSYSLLMWVLFFLGCGFGALFTCLATYACHFFSSHSETPLTALYIVLSIGCAIGPLLFTLCLSLSIWWMAPLLTAVTLTFIGILSNSNLPRPKDSSPIVQFSMAHFPKGKLFLVLAALSLLYGLCETLISTWGTVFLNQERGMSIPLANYALSIFWLSIAAGRILLSVYRYKLNPKVVVCILPLLLILGFLLIAKTSCHGYTILSFSLAGLGCSGLLPLLLSLSQRISKEIALLIGILSGFYIIGYGLASSGMASVERRSGMNLSSLFILGGAFAAVLAIMAFIAARRKRAL